MMAWRRIAFVFLLVGFITAPRVPAAAEHVEIFVTAPYLDVRSGPGRGYPVFYAFERGDSVHVLRQRTDWILVRGQGVEGWAATEDLAGSRDKDGAAVVFAAPGLTDYRQRRFVLALVGGGVDGETAFGLRADWRIVPMLTAELGFTHIPGTFSSTRQFDLNAVFSPFSRARIEPVLTAGVGYFENVARPTLVDGETSDDRSTSFGVGVRAYLSRNLMLRGDIRRHTIHFDDDRRRFNEYTVGLGIFF